MRLTIRTARNLFALVGGFGILLLSMSARADVVVGDYGFGGNSNGIFKISPTTGAPSNTPPIIAPVGSATNPFDPGYEGMGYQAEGSAYGPNGNLYVGYFIAQGNNNTGIGEVREFNAVTGEYVRTIVAPGSAGLVQPGDIKFAGGQMYVADHGNIIDPQGPSPTPYGGTSVYTYDASTGANTGAIDFGYPLGPSGLAFDPRPASLGGDPNNLYISLFNSNQVMQYNVSTHNMVVYASGPQMYTPSGIAFGPNGDLYVVNLFTNSVQQYHESGGVGQYVTSLPSTGDFSFPSGIAFTQGGQFLVSTLGPGVAQGAVLSYNSGTNSWDALPGPAGLFSPGPLTLTPISGDGNSDGVVNGLDISQVASHWASGGPTGDVNHDGVVNGLDIALIASNWFHTSSIYPPGPGTAAAVPEPSAFLLAAMAGLLGGVGIARRRRHA